MPSPTGNPAVDVALAVIFTFGTIAVAWIGVLNAREARRVTATVEAAAVPVAADDVTIARWEKFSAAVVAERDQLARSLENERAVTTAQAGRLQALEVEARGLRLKVDYCSTHHPQEGMPDP